MKQLAIIGASGHGKVIADIALLSGYDEVIFLDDNPEVKTVGEYNVLGNRQMAAELAKMSCDFIVGIGNAAIREKIQNEIISKGCNVVTLVHPNAVVAFDSKLGIGTVVMAGAVINSGSVIGQGCIINTGASIDHDNVIGDFCHISVGAHTAGTVSMGTRSWLGIGAVVSNNLDVCSDCMIGAGAVVVSDLTAPGTYVGVPAQSK
ncbi:MAG: acetyltransferase [Pseudobutyrivibrio sp.]|nr:acetyltransferase [Pseudobutyrivibrio sp.]